jgi:hypothetical protein
MRQLLLDGIAGLLCLAMLACVAGATYVFIRRIRITLK